MRNKLVLPLPFGPVSWTKVPGDTAKSSPLKSLRSPRTHPSLLTSKILVTLRCHCDIANCRLPIADLSKTNWQLAIGNWQFLQVFERGSTGPFAFNHACQPPWSTRTFLKPLACRICAAAMLDSSFGQAQ